MLHLRDFHADLLIWVQNYWFHLLYVFLVGVLTQTT